MASDVRIGILGPLEARVGFGEPVEVAGPRLRTLLVRPAPDPDRVVLVSQLVDAVWGEEPPAQAANALQSLVSRLRRLLPDVVGSHPAGYRLALDPEAVDAVQFEALARAGRGELRRDPGQAAATLREALALWRGPALADAAEAGFAEPAAVPPEELRAVHLAVLRGEVPPAAAGQAPQVPPPPSGDTAPATAARTNLRAQITSFVGRDDDIARITGVLADARLVTLTGPGGAGKTRLAGEAAARLVDRMPDGVWMVELGSVVDPADLPQAVLALFGARELALLAPRGTGATAPA